METEKLQVIEAGEQCPKCGESMYKSIETDTWGREHVKDPVCPHCMKTPDVAIFQIKANAYSYDPPADEIDEAIEAIDSLLETVGFLRPIKHIRTEQWVVFGAKHVNPVVTAAYAGVPKPENILGFTWRSGALYVNLNAMITTARESWSRSLMRTFIQESASGWERAGLPMGRPSIGDTGPIITLSTRERHLTEEAEAEQALARSRALRPVTDGIERIRKEYQSIGHWAELCESCIEDYRKKYPDDPIIQAMEAELFDALYHTPAGGTEKKE